MVVVIINGKEKMTYNKVQQQQAQNFIDRYWKIIVVILILVALETLLS